MLFFESPRKFESETDEKVLARSLIDPRAFSLLVSRYESMFLRKSFTILKEEEEARDAVQDTFVKIYAHAESFREQEGGSFKAWAFKILMNTCFSRYADSKKRWKTSVSIDQELVAEPSAEPESFRSNAFLDKDALTRALEKLPPRMAKLLTLHYVDEKPQKEIAQMMNVSPEAIRVRIHRAKKELKKVVKDQT